MKKLNYGINGKFNDLNILLESSNIEEGGHLDLILDSAGSGKNFFGADRLYFTFALKNFSEDDVVVYINNSYNNCKSTKYGYFDSDSISVDVSGRHVIPQNSFIQINCSCPLEKVYDGDYFHFHFDKFNIDLVWKNKDIYLMEKGETADDIEEIAEVSNAQTNASAVAESLSNLDSLIGLSSVKKDVRTLANFIRTQQMRKDNGLKTTPISYHCVFTGNPGTGKTTVARILANIYKNLGVVTKGQFVETDRSGLVAEYVGQTAPKTNEIIDKALDGILFIDEAYSLANRGSQDFGHEAIATLLKRMEDDRERLVVILAGYEDEMKNFIDSNPGLQSRFRKYIHFDDYACDDLMAIFNYCVTQNDYVVDDNLAKKIKENFDEILSKQDRNFGNGRYVRNLFESLIERQSNRIAELPTPTVDDLKRLTLEDYIE